MKLELRVVNGGSEQQSEHREDHRRPGAQDEAVIDIAQVLAANQTLLKNMIRKVETLENRLGSMMEYIAHQQQERLAFDQEARHLLAAPVKPVETWHSEAPSLDSSWYSRFDFWTRWFNPEKMRRPNSN